MAIAWSEDKSNWDGPRASLSNLAVSYEDKLQERRGYLEAEGNCLPTAMAST